MTHGNAALLKDFFENGSGQVGSRAEGQLVPVHYLAGKQAARRRPKSLNARALRSLCILTSHGITGYRLLVALSPLNSAKKSADRALCLAPAACALVSVRVSTFGISNVPPSRADFPTVLSSTFTSSRGVIRRFDCP